VWGRVKSLDAERESKNRFAEYQVALELRPGFYRISMFFAAAMKTCSSEFDLGIE